MANIVKENQPSQQDAEIQYCSSIYCSPMQHQGFIDIDARTKQAKRGIHIKYVLIKAYTEMAPHEILQVQNLHVKLYNNLKCFSL